LVKWRQFAPSTTHLFNTYGQTECTAVTTCAEITSDLAGGIIPLGKPVQNVSVHIFDEQLQPTPLGQSGELYVAGPGLARGYLDQPELTANKFINFPNDSKLN
ncbi:MAG: AMP-binding protein, partial [Terrimicrobiaceae bacterium]